MKIALIGATGQAGSRILEEALRRGYEVTAIARDPSLLPTKPLVNGKKGNVNDVEALSQLLSDHDAVVSAFNPGRGSPSFKEDCLSGYENIIEATQKSGVKRLLIVGGAGSTEVAPGVALVDTPNFPAEYKVEASAMRDVLTRMKRETTLDWTYISPAAVFAPGKRTGNYRTGKDQLVVGNDQQSHISMEDFAIALLDEVESSKHKQQRFTVGY